MLVEAMDRYQVEKREHSENVKGQYLDKKGKTGEKTFFRASEMGNADRKIMLGFFKHQIPHDTPDAHKLRIFENGDYVHDRYQSAWEDMGVLLSMEERLTSKDDEFLCDYDWEWTGHYDGLLNVDILRAHALGKTSITSSYNEDTEEWELDVELDEAYANAIGIFDENGDIAEDYEPMSMVADIKTMNPWGFKKLKEKADLSSIQGYLDQLQFYMYMLNTPYGSIFVESKGNNDVLEVQVIWPDMHEDVEYEFDEDIHGKQSDSKIRTTVTTERFFGSEDVEGSVPRVERLWQVRQAVKKAHEAGDSQTIRAIMPDPCSNEPNKFPCSWSTGRCDFYEHCWGSEHKGYAVEPDEVVPDEAIWEFEDEDESVIQVDNRKVPEGVTYDGFISLIEMGALKLDDFLLEQKKETVPAEEAQKTAVNEENLFNSTGELNLGDVTSGKPQPSEASEYVTDDGEKAIDCLNCGKQITYKRLGNGGKKKCPHCKHTNQVTKED